MLKENSSIVQFSMDLIGIELSVTARDPKSMARGAASGTKIAGAFCACVQVSQARVLPETCFAVYIVSAMTSFPFISLCL